MRFSAISLILIQISDIMSHISLPSDQNLTRTEATPDDQLPAFDFGEGDFQADSRLQLNFTDIKNETGSTSQDISTTFDFAGDDFQADSRVQINFTERENETGSTFQCSLCDDWSCNHKTDLCYCDQLCHIFMDCCRDAPPQKLNSTDVQLLSRMKDFLTCTPNYDRLHSPKTGILIVSSCPVDYSDTTTRQSCKEMSSQNVNSNVVSLTMNLPIVFKNKYCALCHGFTLDNVIQWSQQLHCAQDLNNNDTLEIVKEKCWRVPKSPDGYPQPRNCILEDLVECPSDFENSSTIDECGRYIEPVTWKTNRSIVYRNIHCAKCHEIPESKEFSCPIDVKVHYPNIDNKININILFSLKIDQDRIAMSSGNHIINVRACASDQIFNQVTKQCTYIACPFGFLHRDNNCIPSKLDRILPDEINQQNRLVVTIQSVIQRQFLIRCLSNYNLTTENNIDKETSFGVSLSYSKMNRVASILRGLSICVNESDDSTLNLGHLNASLQNFRNSSNLVCNNSYLVLKTKNMDVPSIASLLEQYINISNASYGLFSVRFQLELSNLYQSRVRNIWYCHFFVERPMNCSSFVVYDKTEYEILDGIAYLKGVKRAYENGKYLIQNEKLYTCFVQPRTGTDYSYMIYLTWCCFAVSVLSLVFIIIFHCSFTEFLNLHGKCIVSLSAVLCFSQSVMLIQSFLPDILCRPIAVLLHYSCLSVFTWCGIMGLDLARKLNMWTLLTVSTLDNKLLFLKYSLFAWIFPGVIVGTCVTVDAVKGWTVLEYGKETLQHCWIGNSTALLYVFTLPCSLIMLSNIICLFVVICGIETAKRSSRKIKKTQKEKGRCVMYTKIFLLLGLSWITSYLASALQMDWMYVTNIIVNGCQGLFLMIGVLYNVKITKVIQKRKYKRSENTNNHIRISRINFLAN